MASSEFGAVAAAILSATKEISTSAPKMSVVVDAAAVKGYATRLVSSAQKGVATAAGTIRQQSESAITLNITNNVWEWPRETIRRSGATVSSPRDIVDTGRLASSGTLSYQIVSRGFVLQYTNTAPYSGIVHYGGYVRGRTYVPPRPWASAVWSKESQVSGVQKVDVGRIVAQELAAAIRMAAG